jgi:hypothetical protein
VLPVARWPIACQNCLTSIDPSLSDIEHSSFPDGASMRSADQPDFKPCNGSDGGARPNCMRMQPRLPKF